LGAAVGVWQWAEWAGKGARSMGQNSRSGLRLVFMLGPIMLMAGLDLLALYRFIIPALAAAR
jgi:hypothetical protein